MPKRIEDYFSPVFYRKNTKGMWEVWQLDSEAGAYHKVSEYALEGTALRMTNARGQAIESARQITATGQKQ